MCSFDCLRAMEANKQGEEAHVAVRSACLGN